MALRASHPPKSRSPLPGRSTAPPHVPLPCVRGPQPVQWSWNKASPEESTKPKFSVLNGSPTQSFLSEHEELSQDPRWYAPSSTPISPALSTKATRSDVRLVNEFTAYLKVHKLDLQTMFCAEPLLSGGSPELCSTDAGKQGQLLAEFLMGRGIRINEQLPNWFLKGNMRGAIKAYMAMVKAGAATNQGQHRMPAWDPLWCAHIGGWEQAPEPATQQDVEVLTRLGELVHTCRLDMAELLARQWGCDPFQWALAQVAQGSLEEPEPWLLEKYFMCKHSVGEAMPLWYATWGVKEQLAAWLDGPQAVGMLAAVAAARGEATPTAAAVPPAPAGAASASRNGNGAQATASTTMSVDLAAAAAAADAAMLSLESTARALLGAGATALRPGKSCEADLVLLGDGAALVAAIACMGACEQGASGVAGSSAAAVLAVRQAKERACWSAWQLVHGERYEAARVARMVVVVQGAADHRDAPGRLGGLHTVIHYLQEDGVTCFTEAQAGSVEALSEACGPALLLRGAGAATAVAVSSNGRHN